MTALAHRLAAKLVRGPDATQAPAPLPQLNREERLIFTAYVSMATLITAFLAATLTLWLAT